jgi:hypothetical protein
MKLRKTKDPKPVAATPVPRPVKDVSAEKSTPNPPRTTTGWITSPKFGSAGSGGAEFEPGTDLD